jgi:cobalt-zinc-cadmium efflux system outer membrane protein
MKRWYLLIIPILGWGAIVLAQKNEDTITFAIARELILKQNPGLKAAKTKIDASRVAIDQSRMLPNPEAELVLDKFGFNEIEVSVGQTIELGGKGKLRVSRAKTKLEAAQNECKNNTFILESEMIRRYIPVINGTRKLAVLDTLIEMIDLSKVQIEKKINAGASKKTDLLRIEIELERYRLERSELVRSIQQARKNFASLGGNEYRKLLNVKGNLNTDLVIPSLDELKKSVKVSSAILAIEIDSSKLSFEQRLVKAEAIPDLKISAGLLFDNVDNKYSPLVGLSMGIPLWNKNVAACQELYLEQQALTEQKKEIYDQLVSTIDDIVSKVSEIDTKLHTLKTSTIPKADSVHALIMEYYTTGSVSYPELTDAQGELLMLQMEYHDIEAERAEILVDLKEMTNIQIQIIK